MATTEWPLVGRQAELEGIARARADSGCRGVVLSAAAGRGKSRLAREACAAAERDGALVEWVQATSSAAAVPLGAFAAVLPDDVRTDDPLELMRRSADALRERAGTRTAVLGVDDAQLLDPVSAALVLHLTVSGSAFVVATVRSGEPCPDAIVSLWKDAGADRLELRQLSDDAIQELLEAALGGPLEHRALRWICETSQGNALYVRELVIGALADGTLAIDRELWRLSSRPTVSQSLVDLVTQRMDGLSDDERTALELLALGEPLRLSEVDTLTDHDALLAAEQHGLLTIAADEVRLAHPLYGDVIRRDLPGLRSRDVRLRLAKTLGQRDPLVPGDALRIARWLLDANATIPVALLLDAAEAATLAGDPEFGADLAERARAAGGGVAAALVLARAYSARHRFEEAEEVLGEIEDEVRGGPRAIEYVELRAFLLFWGLRRLGDLEDLLARAQAWSSDADWQRQLLPTRLSLPILSGHFAPAPEQSAQALADPQLSDDVRLRIEAVHASSLYRVGRGREARELIGRSDLTIPTRTWSDTVRVSLRIVTAVWTGEDLAHDGPMMEQILRDAIGANALEPSGIAAFGLGVLGYLEGRYSDARRWLTEAEVALERRDMLSNAIAVRAMQTAVAVATSDLDAADAAHARLRRGLEGREPVPTQAPNIVRADAWLARARGDLDTAHRSLIEAAAANGDQPGIAVALAYEALRLGVPATTIAPLVTQSAERCDFRLARAYAAHATAAAAQDGAALLAAGEAMAEIGALRYALEAACAAATVFVDAGREDSARRAVARARELYAPDQGGSFPEIDGLDADAVALTARESQLVELAAQGLTNAEIADRLVLSVRTVESHIYRAMQKLGVDRPPRPVDEPQRPHAGGPTVFYAVAVRGTEALLRIRGVRELRARTFSDR